MDLKLRFLLLGVITLVLFPIVGYLPLSYFKELTWLEIVELDALISPVTLIGLELGLAYGFIVLLISNFPVFQENATSQMRLIKRLNLNYFDIIFMSLAAGFGEEILFRVSLQTWLGPILTSFIFIAVHGYFHPLSIRKSAPGFLLLPFILILSYAYIEFGLWFCVAAHFSYDFLMFMGATKEV